MNRIRDFIQRMMRGRYGTDDFGRVTLVVSCILYIISAISGWMILYYLGFVGLIYTMYRCFSRDIQGRSLENQRFLKICNLERLKFDQRKEYKIFRCKSCGRNIRVPRKKGKIEVTCPVCGSKSRHRT